MVTATRQVAADLGSGGIDPAQDRAGTAAPAPADALTNSGLNGGLFFVVASRSVAVITAPLPPGLTPGASGRKHR
jgi:hypothetical protein